jgi:hypothetical protein
MKGVPDPGDFVSPALIPTVPVRVAALDGENSDPANGLTLEGNLRAYSIWGELADWPARAATSACAKATVNTWRRAPRRFASSSAANRHSYSSTKFPSTCERWNKRGPDRAINSPRSFTSYMAALKAEVAAVTGDQPALAQQLDNRLYPGRLPITSYLANTIFLHTLAYGDSAKGISPERLKFSVCSPGIVRLPP